MTWRFWIDRGGTFTDCIGVDPGGGLHVTKVLSSDVAPLVGIRSILGLPAGSRVPPCEVRMGTTVATNALLERRGAPTTLFITEGFRDLLEIGDQSRPELFALDIQKAPPLADAVVEVPARGRPDGRSAGGKASFAIPAGVESAAVAVLHGTRAPELERRIGEALTAGGARHVSLSHEVDAEQGLLARAQTTVVDAYLTPLIEDYVEELEVALAGSDLAIMQSSGALTDARGFRGRNAVLSGPAGGVVAVAYFAERLGIERAIGFDMGGTSTDVCRLDPEIEKVYRTEVAGAVLRAPMMAIHTVAAGGGSICAFDGRRLTVGPESAGAEPGPLAYGRPGAEAVTLTDVQVALGRLVDERFPFALDVAAPRRALRALATEVYGDGGRADELATGFFRVAVANMAQAIRTVTIARGHDPRDHALIVFGGAGGQHACAVARELSIGRVIAPPLGGVLSAFGMGVAPLGWHGEADVGGRRLEAELHGELETVFAELEARGRAMLPGASAVRRLDLRYEGTETGLTLRADALSGLRTAFDERHRAELGYARLEHPVVATTARVELLLAATEPPPRALASRGDRAPIRRVRAYVGDAFQDDVPVLAREDLAVGRALEGPALVIEDTGVIVVEPGWTATLHPAGALELVADGARVAPSVSVECDPVSLEILSNALTSVAEQMGVVLQRTAMSTNIRERLDFSCAIFDAGGSLVANAPHIPVHLGAMGETVRAVTLAHPDPAPGDVFVSNDPALGGSHLPDITVVSPVHAPGGEKCFFVASRGHHADVGGITPGSMPAHSTRLDEEGVVFRAVRAVAGGRFDRDGVLAILRGGPHPARNPEENLADLEAQIAANHKGASLLLELAGRYGFDVIAAYMAHVQEDAAERVADAIGALPDGRHGFEDALDDGAIIRVEATVHGRTLDVDFTGTAAERIDSNLNAPRAVTVAALLYVLRCLVDAPIPLNAGCLVPVQLTVPSRSLLDPSPERAVAAGNVETSQRVVDVLLGALGVAAASQGTMNNVTFGDASFGYYETVAGGAGAGPDFDGASCVHTHMTNSRITDPEVLEDRFPVRLIRFARRRGSGGGGAHPGGDGVIRELEALAPLSLSVLSERRVRAPFGLAGGESGAPGRNVHIRGATRTELPGKAVVEMAVGDRFVIETPGGGGFGEAPTS